MNLDRKYLSMTLWCATLLVLFLLATGPVVMAGGSPNACDEPGDEPDVIVGSIHQMVKNGTVGNITAFSIGTTSCNVGTCWLNWFSGGSNQHPTIGQNMFRLKDGRFEHIAQAWLKHGFFALSQNLCSNQCIATSGTHLGVNCSDPYSAGLNGQQSGMGPKFEVNAATGFHPHPVTDLGLTGNAIFKRLQVHHDDLDPALNVGAQYFVEAHYIAQDDAAAGNHTNNASYRRINVSGSGTNFNASLTGPTERESPGIRAWSDADPTVTEISMNVPDDGQFIIAYTATDIGAGMWHYEYALHNLTSHRSAGSFSIAVPMGGVLTNIEFHDVDYHSGEPFDNTDWTDNGGAGGVLTWTNGTTFDDDPDANALRWGTLYNFRFDSDAPPGFTNLMTVGLFRPGVPDSVGKPIQGPLLCNDNGTCDPGENCSRCPDECANDVCDAGENPCNCPADCDLPSATEDDCSDGIDNDCDGLVDCDDDQCCLIGGCSQPDSDNDGFVSCEDCNDGDADAWDTPGEAVNLLAADNAGVTEWSWDLPLAPGGNNLTYDVLRGRSPNNFVTSTTCLAPVVPTDTELDDGTLPLPGAGFYYLVRPINGCPAGDGPLGSGTDTGARDGRSCP